MNYSTVIIPAFNEGMNIVKTIDDLRTLYNSSIDVIVVVDFAEDTTIYFFNQIDEKPKSYRIVVQSYGAGPANAIRFGIDQANTECVVVMMADGSDDVRAIKELSNLVRRGVAVACASRYMLGGNQLGGKWLKMKLSKFAGSSFQYFTKVETCDLTNSFKGYSRDFIDSVGISAKYGFELGIEMVAKAHRTNKLIAEIPTIWVEKQQKKSRFKIARWAPVYIKWYLYGLGINFGEKKSSLFSRQRR